LPPGRAWTPLDRFTVPGHTWFAPDWLNTDPGGIPIVMAQAVGGIGQETQALRWADSLWTVSWAGGFAMSFSWPILSPPGTHYLLWKGIHGVETPTGVQVPLVMSQFFGDHIGDLDTLGMFYSGSWRYGAAVADQRRWVAVSDRRNLRLFHSDAPHAWTEVEVPGAGDRGVGIAPLDDSTSIVAWAGLGEGLRWGVLRGGTWTDGTLLDPANFLSSVPRFRPRASGGHWLVWGSQSREHEDHQPIATFNVGAWSVPESLRCAGFPNGFWTGNPDLSRDDREYPAVVWVATDATGTGRENLCVCMPTDSGFTVADMLPYTGVPTIARDRDGDVWVAWWDLFIGMFWLHTYNRATAEDVRIEGHGRSRRVAWTLSEPAPETWWAVLRARGQEDFALVARVRAGPSLDMSWADSSPPAGPLSYRIRRESVDTRYRWESPVLRTPERGKALVLRTLSPRPIWREGVLQLANAAAGPLDLRLYDLQGRVVLQQQRIASGLGEDTVRFDLGEAPGPLRNGIYFAAVRDAAGESSDAVKLVILR
jgi:hypothetical protein